MMSVDLPNGSKVECSWTLPTESARRSGNDLVVLVPSAAMRDLDGNGKGTQELRVRRPLLDLSRALGQAGFATFRFEQPQPITAKELVVLYEKSLQHPLLAHDPSTRVFMIGFGEGADLIARHYYDLFDIRRLDAAVLLSSTVQPIFLNNFTCAYLLLHGMNDPVFQALPYKRLEDAVHHHQMRYGDQTTNFLFPFLGRELGADTLDDRVIRQVLDWCGQLARSRKHPLSAYGDIRSRQRMPAPSHEAA